MSVLIKGAEMPKGCATCPYCDRAWHMPKCKAKSTQGRYMEQRYDLHRIRQKWCPLVPFQPQPQKTNADRIRSMTDEELSEWIAGDVLNLADGALAIATEAWLDWLKQGVEE